MDKDFSVNQLKMARDTLNFQWKKAEQIYPSPLKGYSNLDSVASPYSEISTVLKEILVHVNKAVSV